MALSQEGRWFLRLVGRDGADATRLLSLLFFVAIGTCFGWVEGLCHSTVRGGERLRKYGVSPLPTAHAVGLWAEQNRVFVVSLDTPASGSLTVRQCRLRKDGQGHVRFETSVLGEIDLTAEERRLEQDRGSVLVFPVQRAVNGSVVLLVGSSWSGELKLSRAIRLTSDSQENLPVTILQPDESEPLRAPRPWESPLISRLGPRGAVIFGRRGRSVLHVTVPTDDSEPILVRPIRAEGPVLDARWAGPDQLDVLHTAHDATRLVRYDVSRGTKRILWSHPNAVSATAGGLDDEGNCVLLYMGQVWELWKKEEGRWRQVWRKPLPGPVSAQADVVLLGGVALWSSPLPTYVPFLGTREDLSTLAAIDLRRAVLLWQRTLPKITQVVPVGSDLVLLGASRSAQLLSVKDGNLVRGIEAHFGTPVAVAASAQRLVTAEPGLLILWDRRTQRLVQRLEGISWWGAEAKEPVVWCGTQTFAYRLDLATGRLTVAPLPGSYRSARLYHQVPVRGGEVPVILPILLDDSSIFVSSLRLRPTASDRLSFWLRGFDPHDIMEIYEIDLLEEDHLVILSGHMGDASAFVGQALGRNKIWLVPTFGGVIGFDTAGRLLALATVKCPPEAGGMHFEVWDGVRQVPLMYGGFSDEEGRTCYVSLSPDGRHLVWSKLLESGGWIYEVYRIPDGSICSTWGDPDSRAASARFATERAVVRILANGRLEERLLSCRCPAVSLDAPSPPKSSTMKPVRWVLYAAAAFESTASGMSLPKAVSAVVPYLRRSPDCVTITFPVWRTLPLNDMARALRQFGRPVEIHLIGPVLTDEDLGAELRLVVDQSSAPHEGGLSVITLLTAFGKHEGGKLYLWAPWIARRLKARGNEYYSDVVQVTGWSLYALDGDLPEPGSPGYRPRWVRLTAEELEVEEQ